MFLNAPASFLATVRNDTNCWHKAQTHTHTHKSEMKVSWQDDKQTEINLPLLNSMYLHAHIQTDTLTLFEFESILQYVTVEQSHINVYAQMQKKGRKIQTGTCFDKWL